MVSKQTSKKLSFIFSLLLLFQLITPGFAAPMQVLAEGNKEPLNKQVIKEGVIEDPEAHETEISFKWSVENQEISPGDIAVATYSDEYEAVEDVELIDDYKVATLNTKDNTFTLKFNERVEEHSNASGKIIIKVKKKDVESQSNEANPEEAVKETENKEEKTEETVKETENKEEKVEEIVKETKNKEEKVEEIVKETKNKEVKSKENKILNKASKRSVKNPVDSITVTPNKEPMSRGGIGKVDISWSIADGSYKPGDLIKIQLPEDLSYPSKQLGDEYLQCSVVGDELFCVFTDAIEGKVDVSGEIWYETMYLPSEKSDSENPKEIEKDFNFSSEGDIFTNTINVILPTDGSGTPGQHKTHRDIEKWASDVTWKYGEDGSKVLAWQVELNGNLTENLGETVYKDTLGVGHEVIPDSIKVSVVHSHEGPTGTNIVKAPYEGPEPFIEVAEDKKSFTVTFANKTLSGYRADIKYETRITDENVGKWVNNGNVDNDKYNSGKTAEYLNTDSGAQDRAKNPDPSTIKFLKVEEDLNGPGIAGVEFNIYNADGEFVTKTLHPTDHNGNATIWTEDNGSKLEPGTYYATEILGEANSDYEVNESFRYYFVITEDKGTVLTIINEKKEKVKTSIKVNKKWENDTEADRPKSIEVQLYQNDQSYGDKVTLNESDDWTHIYTDLPKYDLDGELYKYTVKEVEVPEGYTSKVDGTTITNTFTEKTYAIGDYVWVDSNKDGLQDADETALADVKVELFDKEGNKVAETKTDEKGLYIFDELESGDYKVKFTLTKEQAEKYEFTKQNSGDDTTVDSDADKDGWTQVFTLDDQNKNLTKDYKEQGFKASEGIDPTWDAGVIEKEVLTPLEPAKTKLAVEKVWEGKEQEKVTINLLADGEKVDAIELSKDNNWKHTFKDLPVVNDVTDKKAIDYTIEEVEIAGYISTITGNAKEGFTVTNTEKTYAIGDYVWVDSNKDGLQDADETALADVKVELFDKEGNKVAETKTDEKGLYIFDELESGDYKVKFTLTKEQAEKYEFTKQNSGDDTTVDSDADKDGWTQVFTLDDQNKNLTKDYKEQGFKASEGIDPTWDAGVIEKEVLTPLEPAKTKLAVEKVWEGKEQEKVTINLLADGEKVDAIELSKDNNWKHTFKDLPVVNDVTDKKAIDYTIEEVEIAGYISTITGNAKEGFTVTNTEIVEEPTVPEINKTVEGANHLDVEFNQAYTYEIKTKIPSNIDEYAKFNVTDKVDAGLKVNSNGTFVKVDGEVYEGIELTVSENDVIAKVVDFEGLKGKQAIELVIESEVRSTTNSEDYEDHKIPNIGQLEFINSSGKAGELATNPVTVTPPTPEDPPVFETVEPEEPKNPTEKVTEKEEDDEIVDVIKGKYLPKTATFIYSIMLLGFMSLLLGFILTRIKKVSRE